jgi:type II secretory pathway pseudopilin PulG
MKKYQFGLTLIEVALALLISSIVGLFVMKNLVSESKKEAAKIQGAQLNQLRVALQSYVEAYRDNIANNVGITINGVSYATATQARSPTVTLLKQLSLLSSGFSETALLKGAGFSICGYDSTATILKASPTYTTCPALAPVPSGCLSSVCSINGYVRMASVIDDADFLMGMLAALDGKAAFALTSGNLRVQNSAAFIPNDLTGKPVGVVAGVFGVSQITSKGDPISGLDYCPGGLITISTQGKNKSYVAVDANNVTRTVTAGNGFKGNCSNTFAFGDTTRTTSSMSSGVTSGNTSGAISVTCNVDSVTKALYPSFQIYAC